MLFSKIDLVGTNDGDLDEDLAEDFTGDLSKKYNTVAKLTS
jgi:hypothetical protein